MIIKLTEYKDPAIYTNFFDVVIKKVAVNRDIYLEDLDISPSTYKRVKNHESKRGKLIIEKLSDHFNYKIPTNEFIDELEEKFNKIYHNVYYKIETEYENDLEYLDELLKENYIIYPLINVVKLLIMVNYHQDIKRIFQNNDILCKDINLFIPFYNSSILDICELFNILSLDNIESNIIARNFKNELCYSALAASLFRKERYVDCLYLSEKIKKQYIIDENYKRIISINLNIMVCYNSLEEYESAYELSKKQMLTLDSIGTEPFYRDSAEYHYLVACFGLGKFQEIISTIDKMEKQKMKYTLMVLIAKYKISIDLYLQTYDYYLSSELSDRYRYFINLLNDIIYLGKYEKIDELFDKKYNIPSFIITIIKKMFEVKN